MSEHSAEIDARVSRLEAQVDALTRALHLTTVAAKPTSEWLDAQMEKIERTHVIPPEEDYGTNATACAHGVSLGDECDRCNPPAGSES